MWRIEYDPDRSLLELRATGVLGLVALDELTESWIRALQATASKPTVVLFDLRGLEPLEGDAVERMRSQVKQRALALAHVRRLVILVDSAINTMQQRHAIIDGEREEITRDPAVARTLLWPES